ncbi:MAG: hypothetical protein LBR89_00375, partial [Holosporales bacterium]|nr:hypothetical protein [Holosporales bacterium]
MIYNKNIKWLIVGILTSLNTNLNATTVDMQPYISGLLDRCAPSLSIGCIPADNDEYCLYFECPIVFGNVAVRQLSPSVKANLDLFLDKLDLFLCNQYPIHKVKLLASNIFSAMLTNGQSWFGIERYMHERNIKNGYEIKNCESILTLRKMVQSCMFEWFKQKLSKLAPKVVQCIREERRLPQDVAVEIATASYKTDHCCVSLSDIVRNDGVDVWVRKIYAGAYAEAGDDDIREKCKDCIAQINGLKSSIAEQDP